MMCLVLNMRIFHGTGTDTVLIYLNYSVWLCIVLFPPETHGLQSFFFLIYFVCCVCVCGGVVLYLIPCTIHMQCSGGQGIGSPGTGVVLSHHVGAGIEPGYSERTGSVICYTISPVPCVHS